MTTDELEKRMLELCAASGACEELQTALRKLLHEFDMTNRIVTANYLHIASEHMELELTEKEVEDIAWYLCEQHEQNIYVEVSEAIEACCPRWKRPVFPITGPLVPCPPQYKRVDFRESVKHAQAEKDLRA